MMDRIRRIYQECLGHSPGEYALLAALMAAGLTTAVLTYLGANLGAVIIVARWGG